VASRFIARLATSLGIALTSMLVVASGHASASGNGTVVMTAQTTTVAADISGQSAFSLSLAARQRPPTGVTISTQLFARLTTRSGFFAALSGAGPSSPIDRTEALSMTCLPGSPHGGRLLTIDVLTSASTTPTLPGGCSGSASPPTYDLRCQVGSGACNGVYPVQVTVSAGGTTLRRFTTFLTFVEHPAAQTLKLGLVLRLADAGLSTPLDAHLLAQALRRVPLVPVDLVLAPRAIQRLETTAPGQAALAELRATVAADPAAREILRSPYVPIEPGTLASSNLAGEISQQRRRGSEVRSGAGLAPGSSDAGWLATAPVTSSTTTVLASLGIGRLLIPDGSLAEPTATSLTWGQPFTLSPGASTVTALAIDPGLSAEMSPGADPVLAANQMLADLAFLHFERPSLSAPQGAVAVSPQGWADQTGFLSTLLDGLVANPLVAADSVSRLFDRLHVGANGAPSTRRLASSSPSPAFLPSQSQSIALERARLGSFTSSVRHGGGVLSTVDDSILAAESDRFTSPTRSIAVTHAVAALDAQLATVQIGGSDITLTALKGEVPITLTSTAPYTVVGTLELHSDHLHFPNGSSSRVVLNRSTQSLRVATRAVTTGDLPMEVELVSADHGLIIASQRITVHATQSSIVAIVLTAGAALVLLAWWVRTWWRRPDSARKVRR